MISRVDFQGLREYAQSLSKRVDGEWYADILHKDTYDGQLSDEERAAIIAGSITAAEDAVRLLASDGIALPARDYAKRMGLTILHKREGVSHGFLCMGLYQPGTHQITRYDDVIDAACGLIVQCGLSDLTHPEQLEEVVLYHELFHALEESTPGIYTRSLMLIRKHLGLFAYHRGVSAASEIGAVHFSKLMSGMWCSPCIYEQYLLWATGYSL